MAGRDTSSATRNISARISAKYDVNFNEISVTYFYVSLILRFSILCRLFFYFVIRFDSEIQKFAPRFVFFHLTLPPIGKNPKQDVNF